MSCSTIAVMETEKGEKRHIGRHFGIQFMVWNDILQKYVSFLMQTYLTDVWGLSFRHAAGILNIWEGIQMILPAFILSAIDEFLSNFKVLVICGIANTVGMGLIAMSTPPMTGTCEEYKPECIKHPQKVLFYTGMATLAVALAGYKVSLFDFNKEQGGHNFYNEIEEDSNTEHSQRKTRHFIFRLCLYFTPSILGVALPQETRWSVRFGVPAIFTLLAVLVFVICSPLYEKKEKRHQRSPMITVFRVITASTLKISRPLEKDSIRPYEEDYETRKRSNSPRFLDKATIDENPENIKESKWLKSSGEDVKQAKIVIHMIPMWITFIMCGIVSSIGNTYLVEQLNNLDRGVGNWNVPLPMFLLLTDFVRYIFTRFAHNLCLKADRKQAKYRNAPIVGVAVAMVFSVLCCLTAGSIERRRLNIVRRDGLLDKPDEDIHMHAYWQFFPFFLLAVGGADAIKEIAAVFYKHYPLPDSDSDSMENYLDHFTDGVFGLSYICSVLSVCVVGKISATVGKKSWFQFTLNKSRLDKYYWVLSVLSSINLVAFTLLAYFYYWEEQNVDETREAAVESPVSEASESRVLNDHRKENVVDTSLFEIQEIILEIPTADELGDEEVKNSNQLVILPS